MATVSFVTPCDRFAEAAIASVLMLLGRPRIFPFDRAEVTDGRLLVLSAVLLLLLRLYLPHHLHLLRPHRILGCNRTPAEIPASHLQPRKHPSSHSRRRLELIILGDVCQIVSTGLTEMDQALTVDYRVEGHWAEFAAQMTHFGIFIYLHCYRSRVLTEQTSESLCDGLILLAGVSRFEV